MDMRRTRSCDRCKAVVPLDQIRLFPWDAQKNILVCENCDRLLKETAQRPVSTNKIGALPNANYKHLSCERCKYTFRVDSSKVGVLYKLTCPYCGKADKIKK